MKSLSRRSFLLGSAATGIAACAGLPRPALAFAAEAPQARAIYDRVFEQMLQIAPEMATGLGLDTGERAALKSRLVGEGKKLWRSQSCASNAPRPSRRHTPEGYSAPDPRVTPGTLHV